TPRGFIVDGLTASPCHGDSGGPALIDERVAGVTSYAEALAVLPRARAVGRAAPAGHRRRSDVGEHRHRRDQRAAIASSMNVGGYFSEAGNAMPSPSHVVLGATGGVGRAVVQQLSAQGAHVRAVNRSGHGPAPPVETLAADLMDR